MVIVIRLVQLDKFPVRHLLLSLIFGLLQAIQCIFLGVLFGSIWGGTLLYTLAFVCTFMITIFVSRAFSIFLCCWLETSLNMTVIECETVEEMKLVKGILVEMPDALVEGKTNPCKYSGGYRLDKGCQNHQNHARPVGEIQNPKENLNPRTLGVVVGLIMGLTIGVSLGSAAYTVSRPQNPYPDNEDLRVFEGIRSQSRVSTGLIVGLCFAVMFFANAISEFGALRGHVIETEDAPV